MHSIKQATAALFILVFGFMAVASLSSGPVYAASDTFFDPLKAACDQAPESTLCKEKKATEGENLISGNDSVLITVANLLALVTATISVIVIIIAGITMSLSAGDSAKIKSSRDAIIYAIVGLIVVALARAIVVFVAGKVN